MERTHFSGLIAIAVGTALGSCRGGSGVPVEGEVLTTEVYRHGFELALAYEVGRRAQERNTAEEVLREIFEAEGVSFPKGSSVNVSGATGDVIVRNTKTNHKLIQELFEKAAGNGDEP